MKTATKKPTRQHPDFTGVPGKLVAVPTGLVFCDRKTRISPYDALLLELAVAPKGNVLQFSDLRARNSLSVRSRKLGMKILFAEQANTLYVQFAGWSPDSEKWKALVREGILDVIQTQPRSPIQIATALRAKHINDVDAGLVDAILKQLEQSGEVLRGRDGSWSVKAGVAA